YLTLPREVLQQLRVEWPSSSTASPETLSALKQSLSQCPYATRCERRSGVALPPEDIICKVHLKNFVEQQGLEGYDPNLGVLLVTEEKLWSLAELHQAVLQGMVSDPLAGCQESCCSVVHVVSCEEEFQQQQMDLLWRILDPRKHLVCGPVKVTNPLSPITRHAACLSSLAYEAWTEVIDILTVAAIRFEMLSTAHRSQITLDLEDSSISTKGTKSGAFVMYNCARLATLFDSYQRAVERGTYPPLPPASELNFSCLREEGEWLLLFSYLLPFPEVLQQAAQLPPPSKGLRITANTEMVMPSLLFLLCRMAPDWPDHAASVQTVCVAGVQVPDPAQHGFQLLLQPGPYSRGESNVPGRLLGPAPGFQ
uniref:DALR anticodon binding domain containing 3 n=1 Tax=Meleagris gallopavo TaxID=9103 RepID=G1N8T4_MELGA